MWKYIEGNDATGKSIDRETARAHFGVVDKKCPTLQLVNGWFAVWTAGPLPRPSDYPDLSFAPKDDQEAKHFSSVSEG